MLFIKYVDALVNVSIKEYNRNKNRQVGVQSYDYDNYDNYDSCQIVDEYISKLQEMY